MWYISSVSLSIAALAQPLCWSTMHVSALLYIAAGLHITWLLWLRVLMNSMVMFTKVTLLYYILSSIIWACFIVLYNIPGKLIFSQIIKGITWCEIGYYLSCTSKGLGDYLCEVLSPYMGIGEVPHFVGSIPGTIHIYAICTYKMASTVFVHNVIMTLCTFRQKYPLSHHHAVPPIDLQTSLLKLQLSRVSNQLIHR